MSAEEEEASPKDVFNAAQGRVAIIQSEINKEMAPARQFGNLQREIVDALGTNWTSSKKNIAKSIIDRVLGGIAGALKTVTDQEDVSKSSYELIKHLEAIKVEVDEYIATKVDNDIFQRKDTGYNDTYKRMLDAYRETTGGDRKAINIALFGKNNTVDYSSEIAADKWPVPDVDKLYVSPCATPTGTCWGYYEDANQHKLECKLKHGVSGVTDVSWWICQSATECQRASEHWVPCRATNCNVLFPPPTREYYDNYQWRLKYHDHGTVCNEPVGSWWNPWETCGNIYFTCEGPCKNSSKHKGSGSGGTATPNPTPTPTPSTPTYHACGIHLTSVSGDHSLQASCSKTDSNGNSCTVTNFYACQSHTCEFPSNEKKLPTCLYCGWEYDPENNYMGVCLYKWSNYYHFSY